MDEVLFVLPRNLPHKTYETVGFDGRLRILSAAIAGHDRFSIGSSQGGLFIEIAEECRAVYGSGTELAFLCGKDAAERIVNWDYGRPNAFAGMLATFELLVAARQGPYEPPAEMRGRILELPLDAGYEEVSATGVRERIRRGEPWEALVPPAAIALVREYYARRGD